MEMIRCPRCAREIPDFSRFCRRCGCAIVWRGQIGAATIPAFSNQSFGAAAPTTTLKKPRETCATRAKAPTVRSSGGGGAGVFAIFAAAGLVCFVNYHAVLRPVPAPVRSTPAYQTPAFPEVTTVPPSYSAPMRSSAVSSRRYVPTYPMPRTQGAPRTPEGIIITPPQPPAPPWVLERSSPREQERDR